jgi:hypothetical protein
MTRKSTLGGLMAALAICCMTYSAAYAQDAAPPPPVKMGLWQSNVTTTMTGFQIPPDVAARLEAMGRKVPGATPQTTVTQSCLTPEEWAKSFAQLNNNDAKCTYTNRTITPQKMSFDMSCASEHGSVFAGHFEMFVDDAEHTHGSAHMKSEGGGPNGQPIEMNSTLTTHYLGADCGSVKPGDAKIIKTE